MEMGPVIERARKSLAALCHGRPANFSCQRVPVEEIESRLSGMGHTLLLLPSVNRGRKISFQFLEMEFYIVSFFFFLFLDR